MLDKLAEKLLELLFPPKCAFCGRITESAEVRCCADCEAKLPRVTPGAQKFDFLTAVYSPLYYEGSVRDALLRFKFQNTPSLSECFGEMIADRLREEGAEFDVLSYVPLSRRRLRKRGYNQSRLLAERIGRELGVPVVPTLEKFRHVKAQSKMKDAAARRANISGCYRVRRDAPVTGQRVLLIDDIVTTGSTLSECARTLLLGGAESVCAATVARKRKT